jgi:hypothetical protein
VIEGKPISSVGDNQLEILPTRDVYIDRAGGTTARHHPTGE